jgi:hypothetical protein
MNKITQKWLLTGLLDQMDESKQNEMAKILDTIAIEVLATDPPDNNIPEKRKHEQFCSAIFPVVRRVFDKLNGVGFPEEKWLMEDYKCYFNENQDLYDDLITSSYICMDGEAEFCNFYCDDVVKRLEVRNG